MSFSFGRPSLEWVPFCGLHGWRDLGRRLLLAYGWRRHFTFLGEVIYIPPLPAIQEDLEEEDHEDRQEDLEEEEEEEDKRTSSSRPSRTGRCGTTCLKGPRVHLGFRVHRIHEDLHLEDGVGDG